MDKVKKKKKFLTNPNLLFKQSKWNQLKNPLPDPLIGPLLEYTHVLGHKGTVKITKNISSNHYRENMYSPCKICSNHYG